MEITVFAEMTYGVLQDTPLDKFIPSLFLPERREIRALSDIPAGQESNVREIALQWAELTAKPGEEYLIAFRDGERFFRIIRRCQGELREALYPEKKPER